MHIFLEYLHYKKHMPNVAYITYRMLVKYGEEY